MSEHSARDVEHRREPRKRAELLVTLKGRDKAGESFTQDAVASSVSKAQQIRRASGALLLNIYKPDCSTRPPTQPQVRLESAHAPGLYLEPWSTNPGVRQAHAGDGNRERYA